MGTWEQTATAKRDSVFSLIPAEWRIENLPSREEQRDVTGKYIHQFLSPTEIEITETDAVGIAAKTTTGAWSAESVTTAFCHRAALAHQLTNCLLEIFFDQAIAEAKKLDAYLAANGKPLGPLHGVPVSLKDQFHVKGVETTMGYVGWTGTFQGKKGTGKERVFESELTKMLCNLGAVLFCKTSVPHTLMSGESINNIMGYVWNPKNRLLSAGGSSGGEGALVGLKGSPLGFGSDIGGSVRIPAGFCGLYGLRPSGGRVPYEGAANSMDGQNTILSVIGPLANSIASLQFVMRAVMTQQPWLHDPLCLEIPWRLDQEQQMSQLVTSGGKLSFGVTKHNNSVQPHPPVERGMDIVCKALAKLGHTMFPWDPNPPDMKLFELTFLSWIYDGGKDVHESFGLSGEPPAPQIEASYGKEPKGEMTASQIAANNVAKREAQKDYMEYWNSTVGLTGTGRPADFVVCPVAPSAAVDPTNMRHYAYTMWVNCLDYTSVVIPVTKVDKNIDMPYTDFKPLNDHDEQISKTYKPDIYDGAPVAVQLVGRRLQEEKMLVLADYVSKAVAAYTNTG